MPIQPKSGRSPSPRAKSHSQSMLQKGAISELPKTEATQGFYSSLFLVPKKDGGTRPVINLKSLNEFIVPHHFKMEDPEGSPKKGGLDDKSGSEGCILHDPNPRNRQISSPFLRRGSASLSVQLPAIRPPWVFTKTLKPAITLLRELGVRLVVYIDDILIMAESEQLARDHTLGLIYLLENLGFIVHPVKRVTTPTQQIEFLGMLVHSQTLELHLPGQKIKKLRSETAKLLVLSAPPTAREVSRLLEKLNSVSQAVAPGPLFCRMIQRDLATTLGRGGQSYETPCPLSVAAKEELSWWTEQLTTGRVWS